MLLSCQFQDELISPEDFLALSAEISYQLTAREFNQRALLALLLGPRHPSWDTAPLSCAIEVLKVGYEDLRRRLGPAAILHPLRTTALLSRGMSEPRVLDLLGALLHDKEEDLSEERLGKERFARMQATHDDLLGHMDQDHRWFLGERLDLLTRKPGQGYPRYLSQILGRARTMPDLLHVKIADRLDNSLDVTVARPGVIRYDLFRTVFNALFSPGFKGVRVEEYHFLPAEREGVQILSNLFKNVLFISLLRRSGLEDLDETTKRLAEALGMASSRVAQWLVLEIFASSVTEGDLQRRILLEVMEYCSSGGIEAIRRPDEHHSLDGLFLQTYGPSRQGRSSRLASLYADKDRLARVVLVFIAIFATFRLDPAYYVKGIDGAGVLAVD